MRATVDLLEQLGYGGVTIEGIAARSQVTKSTIYRWWPSKPVLVMDAYQQAVIDRMPQPDTGDLATDLATFLGALYRIADYPNRVKALAGLMADAQLDPDFAASFRAFTRQRQEALAAIFNRAIIRGELPTSLDISHAIDLVFGPFETAGPVELQSFASRMVPCPGK